MRQRGFTVIELVVVILFLVGAGMVLLFQVQKINSENDNTHKKTAVNAIYYSLEESFYPANKYYPEHIKEDTLKTMDPELLVDPEGSQIGESDSAYRYEPTDCQDGKCKSYTLRAILTGEEDFIKKSRHKKD